MASGNLGPFGSDRYVLLKCSGRLMKKSVMGETAKIIFLASFLG